MSDKPNKKNSNYNQDRLRAWSENFESGTDTSLQREIRRKTRFKKSLMNKMLRKSNPQTRDQPTVLNTSSVTISVQDECETTSHPSRLHVQPIAQENPKSMQTVAQPDDVVQALISLKHCVQQQGQTLLQIQSQLANMEKRMTHYERRQVIHPIQLDFSFEEYTV